MVGLVFGAAGLLASGMGLGYLLAEKNDKDSRKSAPTLNSLQNRFYTKAA
jgi:hypothetical protein